MKVELSNIELAIDFVSTDYFDNQAFLDTETGLILMSVDCVDEKLPDDIYENDKYVMIPCKQDLNLGKSVVLEFVTKELPKELDSVYSMFRSRGAYSRFKSLLEHLGYTEKWYAYENKAIRNSVIEWCNDNSIKYEGDT